MKKSASAVAHSNIALIKYWGKRDAGLNLPAVGSISITLEELKTRTTVTFDDDMNADELYLAGKHVSGKKESRVGHFLDRIRKIAGHSGFALITSENNFPTGAGLASSASAFAALTLAATSALDLNLSSTELSILARQGSGSAARSIFGGFAEMNRGNLPDGSDAFAQQLKNEEFWDLRTVIAVTTEEEKQHGSTDGMTQSAKTSPYYQSWIDSSPGDIKDMRSAIENKDFQKMGELTENSCLKMHAVMLSTKPGLIYWNNVTIDVMHLTDQLRHESIPVYFTIDAGPQVKLITLPEYQSKILDALKTFPDIKNVIVSRLGPGAHLERQSD
jgi:diphosphomevalonate decarboxylase